MRVCGGVFTPFRAATMRTLTGLLAVTGLRVGEAIGLDIDDLDLGDGQVQVRHAKGGKDRLVFLKPSSCQAVASYLDCPRRPVPKDPALSVSLAGTRLLYCNVQEGFTRMTRACRLHPPLVTRSLDPKGTGQARWTMRWKPALNAFTIPFGDRVPKPENH